MKKYLYPILLILAFAVVAIYALSKHAPQTQQAAVVQTVTTTTTPAAQEVPAAIPAVAPSGYTAAQVAAHASAQSCWTSINGNVYDLTSWINQHPGGSEAILSLCGTDGTKAFMQQHGGQGRPEQELATFKIGALAT